MKSFTVPETRVFQAADCEDLVILACSLKQPIHQHLLIPCKLSAKQHRTYWKRGLAAAAKMCTV